MKSVVIFDSDWGSGPWSCPRCRGRGGVRRLVPPFARKRCPRCDGSGHCLRPAPVRSNKETQ